MWAQRMLGAVFGSLQRWRVRDASRWEKCAVSRKELGLRKACRPSRGRQLHGSGLYSKPSLAGAPRILSVVHYCFSTALHGLGE